MVSRAPTAIAAARPSARKTRFEHASKRSGSGMALEGSRHLPERQVHARRSIPTIGILNVESASSLTGRMVDTAAKLHQGVEIHSAGPASDGRWSVQSDDPTGPFDEKSTERLNSRNGYRDRTCAGSGEERASDHAVCLWHPLSQERARDRGGHGKPRYRRSAIGCRS